MDPRTAEPARSINIMQCTLQFSGDQIVNVITAIHELPFRVAKPLIDSIEAQLRTQFPPQATPAADRDMTPDEQTAKSAA